MKRTRWPLCLLVAALAGLLSEMAFAQAPSARDSNSIAIEGTVRSSSGEPVGDAIVRLAETPPSKPQEARTNAEGQFTFAASHPGSYTLTVEKSEFGSCAASPVLMSAGEKKQIVLVLPASTSAQASSRGAAACLPSSSGTMEFEDKPNFTVAGVTDWSGAGGHGSDTTLRTSEAFARETLALKSDGSTNSAHPSAEAEAVKRENKQLEDTLRLAVTASPNSFDANHQLGEFCLRSGNYREAIQSLKAGYQIKPENVANAFDLAKAYRANGDLTLSRDLTEKILVSAEGQADIHRFMGDLDEQLGDPLAAVREYERAATLAPSEPNYFEWGTELLLHRAVAPAVIVFKKGSLAHPNSSRMLVGLGAALYAGGSYEEAAQELCLASDLKPEDATPYLFLGKMEVTLPGSFPCREQKLSRFLENQPQNALANYYFAMSLLKRDRETKSFANLAQAQSLLEKSVSIDPKLGESYLQLGILYYGQGSTEKAITAYTRASEVSPNIGETHYRLSQVYKRMGDKPKADQEIQLYKQVEKTEDEQVERQRREVQQFLIILKDQPATRAPH